MTPGTLAIARLEVDNASVKRHFVGLKIVRLVLMGSMIIRIANLAIVMPKEPSKFFFRNSDFLSCRISSGYITIKEAFVFNLEYSHDQQSVKKSLSSLQPFTERLFSLRNMRFVGCICLADFLYLTASLPLHSVLWKARAQSQIES